MDEKELLEGIAGKSVAALGDNLPDEVRNKTPEELKKIQDIFTAYAKDLHQDPMTGEIRSLSDDEQAAFDYAIEVREAARKRLEHHAKVSDIFRQESPSVKRVYAQIRNGLDDHGSVARMTHSEARDAALRVLDDRGSSAHLRSDEKDQIEQHVRRNSDVARRVVVTETDHYRSAWMKMMTRPDGAMLLDDDERNAMRAYDEYRAASTSNTAGGFGVPVFIDPSIMLTAQGSINPFYQLAKQVEVNTTQWKGVTSAGVSWSFDAEASEVSDDAPTIAQPTVDIFTARGFVPFSLEIGDDYPAWSSEIARLLAEGYDELLVDKFTRGSGSGEPFGVLTVLSASAGARVTIQTAGSAFGQNDPYRIYSALAQRFRLRASWLMSVDVNNKLRQLGTVNNFHAYTESLPAAWADVIFGRGVYESPYMPDTTTSTSANTGLAVFGDFNAGFTIARRAGMTTELVPHLFHTSNNRPSGQRGWFAYSRIGSNVVNTFAMKLLVNTA